MRARMPHQTAGVSRSEQQILSEFVSALALVPQRSICCLIRRKPPGRDPRAVALRLDLQLSLHTHLCTPESSEETAIALHVRIGQSLAPAHPRT